MLVRTSGSRHTGQAAPPHQNIQCMSVRALLKAWRSGQGLWWSCGKIKHMAEWNWWDHEKMKNTPLWEKLGWLSFTCRRVFYALIYFWSLLFGLSGIVCLIKFSLSIGLIIFFLKYSVVLMPQKPCISRRLFGTEQKSRREANLSGSSLTCVPTCGVTCVLICVVEGTEVDAFWFSTHFWFLIIAYTMNSTVRDRKSVV